MKSMYIGSGDVASLLSGKNSQAFQKLMQRFVSNEKQYYNALASPIDALRTGAILENRYLEILSNDYYPQFVCFGELDVLKCSIDFAKIEKGNIVDFDELKTCNFTDFLAFEKIKDDNDLLLDYIKKEYKSNYNQIQQQLYCSKLDSANLVFLAVYSYIDEENEIRNIQEHEYIKIRVPRCEQTISKILERASIFQTIKNYFKD